MKLQEMMLTGALIIGAAASSNAQTIINSTSGETNIWAVPNNTGLAISPGSLDVQAAAFDDGSGDHYINWIEISSGTVLDVEVQTGIDPDIAYYSDESLVAVTYENAGDIFVDEYFLTSTSPLDYTLINTMVVSNGEYPNIDIASTGWGIVTWEDGGNIFVAPYQAGSIGPVVYAGTGSQPDAIVTDNYDLAAVTYIDGGGNLIIETIDYFNLVFSSTYSVVNNWGYAPNNLFKFPRIAAERNAFYANSLEDFTVVVQDINNVGSPTVEGFFVTNASSMNPSVPVNLNFANCFGETPRPVVAYQQGRVRIAWSQQYPGGCSGLSQSSPNNPDDVLVRMFNSSGTISGNYLEVNQFQSTYVATSRTSIASRYDGVYSVNPSNYQGGILFNDPGDLFWKAINSGNPSYMEEQNAISEERGNNFSLVTSPVDQTIEVLSESDDLASFQLLDNAGRVVELRDVSNNNNVYSIDISQLSGGMYFLHCSSASGDEVLRVLQVNK